MNKIGVVIQREYFTRVKKKSFLVTTILVPILIVSFYAIIIAITLSDGTNKTIAVIDEAHLFSKEVEKNKDLKFVVLKNESEESFKTKYTANKYDFLLVIPKMDSAQTISPRLYYAKSLGPTTQAQIEGIINAAVVNKKLTLANIDLQTLQSIKSNIKLTTFKGDGTKTDATMSSVNFGVGFAAGFLIYLSLLIYGTMVMRGVAEEKTNRIAEIIVSSVKPFQLMLGKIIGIGAVGLTQFLIWIIVVVGLQFLIPVIFPSLLHQVNNGDVMQASSTNMLAIMQALSALPLGTMLFSFMFYFLGGYFMYAALFAAVGSVATEDPQESQQLALPLTLPIVLSFIIMTKAVNDPDSGLALFGSLFPLTSPVVMMGRLPYGVPLWQLLTSMLIVILTFLFTTWMAAKIYRTGILLYGKKTSLKEVVKWAFRRS